ncbi:MAG TPA: DUF4175 family protein [Flavobacteriaceae bacterium]|nr:DUF4175 family protein [Flavobacteriaceae bacterium]
MRTFEVIKKKLESFIKRFYTNELIKGGILFVSIGLLYLLVALLIEYYLWLDTGGRKILLWSFVIVEFILFLRFIAFPLTKLFKLRKGIDYDTASVIIGNHFPEVGDKLLNVLQLQRSPEQNELLLAGIEQKAAELSPIPFKNAIQFRKNTKYLKYLLIPIAIYIFFSALGGTDTFSGSYKRMINYDMAFEPPAPFSFVIGNEGLEAIENRPFKISVNTEGSLIPETASIQIDGKDYFMSPESPGSFSFTIQQPVADMEFRFHSNKVVSRLYKLIVVPVPTMIDLAMELQYPPHTGKRNEVIKSGGNATIPEGTTIVWSVQTKNTEEVNLHLRDTLLPFQREENRFVLGQRIMMDLNYGISSSNRKLREYENLSYQLNVIKDQYPDIDIESKKDSTDLERVLFLGKVSDDYGLTKLRLVYFPVGEENEAAIENIQISTGNIDSFTFEFPGELNLKEGTSYEYFFEVFDNDVINNYKSTKSTHFTFRKSTQDELERQLLENQKESIRSMDRSLQEMKGEKQMLDEISRMQKEKNELSFNDRKKLEKFLERQKQQEEMMKSFSEKLKEDLKNFQPERENDHFKEELHKRIEEQEVRQEENEKLLEELRKLQDKIEKEELSNRLEKLSKEKRNQERNLEQLVELTKRYYVERKAEKLMETLEKLGERQENLAKKPEDKNTKDAQEELNREFDKLTRDLEELRKENEELKKPLDIPNDPREEEDIRKEQESATENLDKKQKQDASKNQEKAGQKMKQLARKMQQQMSSGQMETLDEDARMLRQILSNLMTYSFEQEGLMKSFREIQFGNPVYGKKLVVQHELKQNFEHVDDSLFALSLRQPMLGEDINSILTETHFNIDKSLERLAQNQLSQGIANQQYAMKGANDLAVLLDEILSNMQMQLQMNGSGDGEGMPSPGSGGGGGFQLPDIIQQQQSLMDKMEEGMQKGEDKGGQEGGEQGSGEGEGKGEKSGDGEGKDGNGKNGKSGSLDGDGDGDERWSEDLFEIFKQQQKLRQELENKLRSAGFPGNSSRLIRDMEQIEQKLLNKGFEKNVLQDMRKLKYELLKLDEAFFQQGQEEKRKANTNLKQFENRMRMKPQDIRRFFNSEEILNREVLPFHNSYHRKVNEYFRREND